MNRINRKIVLLLILFLLINTPVYGSIEIVGEYGKDATDEVLIEEIEKKTEKKADAEVQSNIKTQSESEGEKLVGVLEKSRKLIDKSNFYTQEYPYNSEIKNYDYVDWRPIIGMKLPVMNKEGRFSWPGLKSKYQVRYEVKHIFKNSDGEEIFREENYYRTYNTVSLNVKHLDNNEARDRVNEQVELKGYDGYRLTDGYLENIYPDKWSLKDSLIGRLEYHGSTPAFVYEYELSKNKESYEIESIDIDTGRTIDNNIINSYIELSEDELSTVSHKDLGFTKDPDYIRDEKLGYINDSEGKEYLLVTNIDGENLFDEENNIKLYFKEIFPHPLKKAFSIRYEDKDGRELTDRFVGTRFLGSIVNMDLYPDGLESGGNKYFVPEDFIGRLNISPGQDEFDQKAIIQNVVKMDMREKPYNYRISYIEAGNDRKIKKDFPGKSKKDRIELNKYFNEIYHEGDLFKPVENQEKTYNLEKNKENHITIWYEKLSNEENSKKESLIVDEVVGGVNKESDKKNKLIEKEELDKEEIIIKKRPVERRMGKTTGYLEGYSDDTVRPENSITREESVVILDRILDEESLEKEREGKGFKDLKKSAWSSQSIDRLVRGGIIDGYKDGYFRPKEFITRGEVAKLLFELAGLEEFDNNSFLDIENHWAKGYINALVDEDIVLGYNDGSFRPGENITRAEFVTMLNKLLGDDDVFDQESRGFKDLSEEKWYYEDMKRAVGKASS